MKYILKTSYPCLVKTQDSFTELEPNDTLEIEDETILFIYPENPKQLSFYINLVTKKDSELYSFIHRENFNLILLESPKTMEIINKETLDFSGKSCQIEICCHTITFETESKKLSYTCPHKCLNYKIFKQKNYACVQFEHDFYAFSMEKNKLFHFQGDDIVFENDLLKTSKVILDSQSRKREATFKFDNDVEITSESFERKDTGENLELVPYKFLEAVKSKDYDYVVDSLSAKLKQNINKEQIQKFFGNIKEFLPLNFNEFLIVSNDKKSYASFSLANGKINDITLDNL